MSVPLGITLTNSQYRALAIIANREGVNAHVLVERLVERALLGPQATGRERRVLPTGIPSQPPMGLEPLPPAAGTRGTVEMSLARDERVRILFAAGYSDRAIAPSAGLTHSGVRARRAVLGLFRDPRLTGAKP